MSHAEQLSGDDLIPWLQDTLDAIEYATGTADTTWGALRAESHPTPFKLPFIEIGNENGGAIYQQNYQRFYREIKSCYPDIQIITNEYAAGIPADIIDEHDFATPHRFHEMYNRFDSYDRTKPKVYFGEYACAYAEKVGTLNAALAEAVFMAGLERNGDQLIMASYAPLFVHRQDRHWENDAIVFDGLQAVPTPSYEVQRLFSIRRVASVIPNAIAGADNIYSSAGYNKTGDLIIKLINVAETEIQLEIPLPQNANWQINCEILSHQDPNYTNTFINEPLQTSSESYQQNEDSFPFTIKAYSLSIITFRMEK